MTDHQPKWQLSVMGVWPRCHGARGHQWLILYKPARLDLGNIQDVADEAQQIAGRAMGNGEGGLITSHAADPKGLSASSSKP